MTTSFLQLGLLPNLGGSLKDNQQQGQLDRLIGYYFKRYAAIFGKIYYFSYQRETLSTYTDDI
jgi:hypothetical protein